MLECFSAEFRLNEKEDEHPPPHVDHMCPPVHQLKTKKYYVESGAELEHIGQTRLSPQDL